MLYTTHFINHHRYMVQLLNLIGQILAAPALHNSGFAVRNVTLSYVIVFKKLFTFFRWHHNLI